MVAALRHWPGRTGRQRFDIGRVLECLTVPCDERRTAVTELGHSTGIRLCPTSWTSSGWPRKPLMARLELRCSGTPPNRQGNCHLVLSCTGRRCACPRARYLMKGWQRHAGSDLETSRETRTADDAERLTRQRLRVSEAA